MDDTALFRLAGWFALVNGIATITTGISLLILFARGGVWHFISNSASIIWALSFLPLTWLL